MQEEVKVRPWVIDWKSRNGYFQSIKKLDVCIGHGWKNWQPTDLQNSKTDVGDLTETQVGEAEVMWKAGFLGGAKRDLSRLVRLENLVKWQQSDMHFRLDP